MSTSGGDYEYQAADLERFADEGQKGSQFSQHGEHRGAFARDRARVLHSAALRRLADKTQVVGPGEGDTPRTRLTHSLEVAQIARGMGSGLGLDPDICDLAGLTHDIGHPPYGHNGERALNEVAEEAGGFEGNAQTLRILARLEPKVMVGDRSVGLNLTRAALDAACKYPWPRTAGDGTVNKKYSAYDEDADILTWVRAGHTDLRPPMEAQVMDWSDDIAYSVHDVEDAILSGRVSLKILWDLVALAKLAESGAEKFGSTPELLIDAAARLRDLDIINKAADFTGSLSGLVTLKRLTSELVGRFVGATIEATRAQYPGTLGRMEGNLVVPPEIKAEVILLKTVAVLYVMDQRTHLDQQALQRDRIFRVYEFLAAGAPGALDPMYAAMWMEADTDAQRCRAVVDQMASMTEKRLGRIAQEAADLFTFYG